MESSSRFDILPRQRCLELLAAAEVGRVVFTDHALPAVLPVTFVLDGETVILRTRERSRLAKAARNAVLAFEIDDIDVRRRAGWSVVVTGRAEIVDDAREHARLDALLKPWAPGTRDLFIKIPMTMLSGRHILPEDEAAVVPASAPDLRPLTESVAPVA